MGGGAGDGKRAVGDGQIPKVGPAGLPDGLDAGGKIWKDGAAITEEGNGDGDTQIVGVWG